MIFDIGLVGREISWQLGFSKDKENPNLSNGRSEDPAGLTTGMTPPPEAPPKSTQVRNGSTWRQPLEQDKVDESGSGEKNIDKEQNKEGEKKSDLIGGSRPLSSCLPKSKITPSLIIRSEGLASHIEYIKDQALIAKFIGFCPMEKDLIWWINYH